MPPIRRSPSNLLNPLASSCNRSALFFADSGRGGPQKAASSAVGVIAVVRRADGRLVAVPAAERKHEIGQLVASYSQQHKQIKVTEVLWDIWTLYFRRPFVPTHVQAGEGTVFAGEPERTSFPHDLRVLHNAAYTVGYCDDLDDPAWVCYRVFDVPGHVEPAEASGRFFLDTRTAARVEPGDYTSSGYDRGPHGAELRHRHPFRRAGAGGDLLMSNVCPQRHRLNAGLWKDMETRIVDNYTGRYGQVWVIDGPVFGPEDRLQRSA